MSNFSPPQDWRLLLPYVRVEQGGGLEGEVWRATLSFQALVRRGHSRGWENCKIVVVDVVEPDSSDKEIADEIVKDCLRDAMKVEIEESLGRGLVKIRKRPLWARPYRPLFFWLKQRQEAVREYWKSWPTAIDHDRYYWFFPIEQIRVHGSVPREDPC